MLITAGNCREYRPFVKSCQGNVWGHRDRDSTTKIYVSILGLERLLGLTLSLLVDTLFEVVCYPMSTTQVPSEAQGATTWKIFTRSRTSGDFCQTRRLGPSPYSVSSVPGQATTSRASGFSGRFLIPPLLRPFSKKYRCFTS